MPKNNYLKFSFYFFMSVAVIFLVIINIIRFLLPNDLVFVEGKVTQMTSPIPISIKTNEDTASVLSITTEPMADAFQMDIGSSITARPIELGESEVTFYLCNTLPVKTVSAQVVEERKVIPVGQSVGITLDTDGLLVLNTGRIAVDNKDSSLVEPAKNILKTGDLLLEANGVKLVNKETLQEVVANCNGEPINFLFQRDNKKLRQTVTPVFSSLEQSYKIGVWVRDSIQGIGTITYYDPESNNFGGLGHGIYDVDTGELMPMKNGTIISSSLTEIVKGQKGEPGELTGTIERSEVLGTVELNTQAGIYGKMEMDANQLNNPVPIPIALKHQVQLGSAVILSNIEGEEIKSYDIEIQSTNGDLGKEIRIEVVDEELISKTGGIIQGMSGSPIIQNGKLVGAVTHVFVNNPTKGYGIFIENMLDEASNLSKTSFSEAS